MLPEAGQDVPIRRILPYDDEETSYAIERGKPPQYGTPPGQQHPGVRMIAAKRAHAAGLICDAELGHAQEDPRRWGWDRGAPS